MPPSLDQENSTPSLPAEQEEPTTYLAVPEEHDDQPIFTQEAPVQPSYQPEATEPVYATEQPEYAPQPEPVYQPEATAPEPAATQPDPLDEDYESEMLAARQKMELVHTKRMAAERLRLEKESRELRRQELVSHRIETTDKLSRAVNTLELEVEQLRKDAEELEATRRSFAKHLELAEALDAEKWSPERLDTDLEAAHATIDEANEEFDLAADYFSKSGSAAGRSPIFDHGRSEHDFGSQFLQGLAFNLPLIIFGAVVTVLFFVFR